MSVKRSVRYGIWAMAVESMVILLGIERLYLGHDLVYGLFFILIGIYTIAVTYLWGVRNRSAVIAIDNEGISATGFRVDKLLWKDIKSAKLKSVPYTGSLITFELYDESKYTGTPPKFKLHYLIGFTRFCIMVDGLEVSPTKIYNEITSHIAVRSQDTSTT